MAFSLEVREPHTARILASELNAEAGRLAQNLEARMVTFGAARNALEGLARRKAALAFEVRVRQGPHNVVPDAATTYTAEQEHAMLLALARELETHLVSEALFNRAHGGLDSKEDLHAQAVKAEMAIGFIYQLVATRGAKAKVDEIDAAILAGRGLSEELIGFVRRETAFHAKYERGTSWLLGVSRETLVCSLVRAGADPSPANIAGLRKSTLRLFSELLFAAERRYASAQSPIATVLAIVRDGRKPTEAPSITPPQWASQAPSGASESQDCYAVQAVQRSAEQPASENGKGIGVSGASLTGFVATLAKRKIKLKKDGQRDGWEEKTADQHSSVAALFTKCAETDDPARMTQAHVGRYRDLLDLLPKNWGKSSKDALRTLEEILVRCEELDDDEIGLAPGTINRHMTQLGNVLSHVKGHGFDIGEITESMRTSGEGQPRAIFTAQDEETLFSSATWTGHEVVHGSSYFVPLLAKYETPRLNEVVGLIVDDIDLAEMSIHIRPNRLRGVKNKNSIRRLPIMPELERLGFCEYVEAISKVGFDVLWPELLLRGTATPMQNLFYKSFSSVLAEVLPLAQIERKHMHSWRKAGNTIMAAKNINDPLRCQILGHAYRDVNGRHYTDEISLSDKRAALGVIPLTTGQIQRRSL